MLDFLYCLFIAKPEASRRFGSRYGKIETDGRQGDGPRATNMDGSVGIVFSKNKRQVLLVKRRDIPIWDLPGGGIENGEHPRRAVIREVLEETGYRVHLVRKIAVYTHSKSGKKNHSFECTVESGKACVGPESREVKFFYLNNLPKPSHTSLHYWIRDALANKRTVIRRKIKGLNYRLVIKDCLFHPIILLRFLLLRIKPQLGVSSRVGA